DSRGKAIKWTEELASESVPAAPREATSGERRFLDTSLPFIGRQRSLISGMSWSGQEFTILLLAPLEEADLELNRLGRVLLFAVPAALALCGAVGYFLASKAFAPIEELRRSTEEITAAGLDQRLPVNNADDELGRLALTINAMIARLEKSFAEIRRF